MAARKKLVDPNIREPANKINEESQDLKVNLTSPELVRKKRVDPSVHKPALPLLWQEQFRYHTPCTSAPQFFYSGYGRTDDRGVFFNQLNLAHIQAIECSL